jgi:hypothetical protein
MNRLNASTKGKGRKKMKRLDEKLQKEEEELAEYKKKHCCCCFEGFINHKCLLCTCITMILISLAVATVISMAMMALLLIVRGNRLLSNGEISEVVPPEKKLQIISQNEFL